MAAQVATVVLIHTRAAVPSGASSEPALKPNQPGADHHERDIVRAHRDLAKAEALTDDEREDKARHTGIDVHHGAARKVDR